MQNEVAANVVSKLQMIEILDEGIQTIDAMRKASPVVNALEQVQLASAWVRMLELKERFEELKTILSRTDASSRIIPCGKHKGRSIDDMTRTEVHTLWAAWNGFEHKKADPFFTVILERLVELEKKGKVKF
jgi:hypothetical protein